MERGESTIQRILDCSVAVLSENGHAALTMRAVAVKAGISPGNLTYYFPTKRELIHATLEHIVAFYQAELDRLTQPDGDPEVALRSVVGYLVHDSGTTEISRLFRELWAMALHDPAVAEGLRRCYDYGFASVRGLLAGIVPSASEATLRTALTLIALASEGSCVISPAEYDFVAPASEVTEATVTAVLRLLEAGVAAGAT